MSLAGAYRKVNGSPEIRQRIERYRPERFIAYCSWKDSLYFPFLIQMAALQDGYNGKFYLWYSFDPHKLQYHPAFDFLKAPAFRHYSRCHYCDLDPPQISHTFILTNDPTYVNDQYVNKVLPDAQVPWSKQNIDASDLHGLWQHTYQLWISRDQIESSNLAHRIQ